MAKLRPERVRDLAARARREVDEGLLPACQLALGFEGELAYFESLGDADDATRFALFSATKPLVTGVIWQLLAEGAVSLSDRIARWIPAFGTHGKEVITLEQVLLHTAGFPAAPLGPPAWWTRAARVGVFSHWYLNWEPGTRYEYHPTSAHWVLAELIERATARDYRDAVAERVTEPCGLPRLLGIAPGEQQRIAELVGVGEPASAAELQTAFGISELPVTEVNETALLLFNDPRTRELGVPGAGGVGRAADLALFYQAVLHNRNAVWDTATLEDARTHVRNRLPDPLLGVPANRTLGLVQAGDDGAAHLRGLGRTTSPRAIGHNGAGGQIAWGDPATGLSFGYLTNGLDRHEVRKARRGIALSSLAAVCAE